MPVEVETGTEKESGIITIRSSFQEYILWKLERSDVFSVRKNFGVVWLELFLPLAIIGFTQSNVTPTGGGFNMKVKLSRLINRHLLRGKPNQMISTRVYIEDRQWAIKLINTIFFWQANHCQQAFYHDLKHGGFHG